MILASLDIDRNGIANQSWEVMENATLFHFSWKHFSEYEVKCNWMYIKNKALFTPWYESMIKSSAKYNVTWMLPPNHSALQG